MKMIIMIFLITPIIVFQGILFFDILKNFKKANKNYRPTVAAKDNTIRYNKDRQINNGRIRVVK
ncbi:hypothetical protein [Sporosalibacterium faouarense]|uniref:hypothetical protein n=1 Tax=Sporosalibacterium faouarense TaxID=516123 RepID=UPI00141C16DB|nr:hypothetical protein [Sporosalibacterium faouarense]MTI48801.1 hypothetical protein [Bacillota bacterium]